MNLPRAIVGFCLSLAAGAADAHEFWIEPSVWRPQAKERIAVTLCVGERFAGRPARRNAARIEEFFLLGSGSRQPVVGIDGSDPAGSVRVATNGGQVLGFRSNHAFIRISGARFEEYLREEGVDGFLAERRARRAGGRTVREAYSRYAKSLIGAGSPADIDRRLGFRMELIAEAPPPGAADDARRIRLLFDGRPLPGARVVATRRPAAQPIEARTDAMGRVVLPLGGRGDWLITAWHMTPAPAGLDADWESYWASLTFNAGSPNPGLTRCTG